MRKLYLIFLIFCTLCAWPQKPIQVPKVSPKTEKKESTKPPTSAKNKTAKKQTDNAPTAKKIAWPDMRKEYHHLDLSITHPSTNERFFINPIEYAKLDAEQQAIFNYEGIVIAHGGEEFILAFIYDSPQGMVLRKPKESLNGMPTVYQAGKVMELLEELDEKTNEYKAACKSSYIAKKLSNVKYPTRKGIEPTLTNELCGPDSIAMVYAKSKVAGFGRWCKDIDRPSYTILVAHTFKQKTPRQTDQRKHLDAEFFANDKYYYFDTSELATLSKDERDAYTFTGIVIKKDGLDLVYDPFAPYKNHANYITWDDAISIDKSNDHDWLGGHIPSKKIMETISPLFPDIEKITTLATGYNIDNKSRIWTSDVASYDKKGNPETIWVVKNGSLTTDPILSDKKKKVKTKNGVRRIYTPASMKRYGFSRKM